MKITYKMEKLIEKTIYQPNISQLIYNRLKYNDQLNLRLVNKTMEKNFKYTTVVRSTVKSFWDEYDSYYGDIINIQLYKNIKEYTGLISQIVISHSNFSNIEFLDITRSSEIKFIPDLPNLKELT